MTMSQTPDTSLFVKLRVAYEEALTNGQRAELRRAASPEDLGLLPSYYRLLPGRPGSQWERVVYFVPHAGHRSGAPSLGEQLARARVSEARLFQVIRSTYPNDLIQMRRLLQHVDAIVDWAELGRTLYYWGDRSKRKLVESYFMALKSDEKGGTDHE
jgi:CRISPR system Cascade subunit CasB